jgi:hypothetical protein
MGVDLATRRRNDTTLGRVCAGKPTDLPDDPLARIRVKPAIQKFSSFQKFGFAVMSPHPASIAEGRIAIVTTREAGCGGRGCADRRAAHDADGEVVWSWRAHAGAKFAQDDARTTVAIKPVHRGEREVSRKTTAQGRPV